MQRDDIFEAVVKRAKGYEATETVEEYAIVDGNLALVKKRITTKDVPPDISAAKLIFEDSPFDGMTDDELEAEKERLLNELKNK